MRASCEGGPFFIWWRFLCVAMVLSHSFIICVMDCASASYRVIHLLDFRVQVFCVKTNLLVCHNYE